MDNKEFGNTPLPYKGMNIREEIYSRLLATIISKPVQAETTKILDEKGDLTSSTKTTYFYPTVEDAIKDADEYTNAAINLLNTQR